MPNPNEVPQLSEAQRADIQAHERTITTHNERALGPGETPKRAPDEIAPDGSRRRGEVIGTLSLEDAEAHGNPIIPRDSTGHKVHPSDAYSVGAMVDVERSQGFGGDGTGIQADARTRLGARGPTAQLSPDGTYRVTERIDPVTGELVRTKLSAKDGQVLDEQREPAPSRQGARPLSEQQRAAYRRDTNNGPLG